MGISMFGPKDGKFAGTNVTVGSLASFLENSAKQIVVDETGLTGHYDFELQCDTTKSDSIIAAIKEQFGFEVTPGKRSVEVLVVEKTTGSAGVPLAPAK
jgi:uncharacterized protein (TIGR03435 family)